MNERSDSQIIGPTASMAGRRVDFGKPGEGGLAWGVEVDLDISDALVRAKLKAYSFIIPDHIKYIKYLDLAPQEALPPKDRTIRSDFTPNLFSSSSLVSVATPAKPGNPTFEKIRDGFNFLRPNDEKRFKSLQAMITWTFGSAYSGMNIKFNDTLKQSKGDTLVIVHGHSNNLSGMGEQYPDEIKDEFGNVIQKKSNFVPIDDILKKYSDPNKFAALVIHGCNIDKGTVEEKNVPVFYPKSSVKKESSPGFLDDFSLQK